MNWILLLNTCKEHVRYLGRNKHTYTTQSVNRVQTMYFICTHFSYNTGERFFSLFSCKCAQLHAESSYCLFYALNSPNPWINEKRLYPGILKAMLLLLNSLGITVIIHPKVLSTWRHMAYFVLCYSQKTQPDDKAESKASSNVFSSLKLCLRRLYCSYVK